MKNQTSDNLSFFSESRQTNSIDDTISESLDLNIELVKNPACTFFARAVGDSMEGCGIDNGDLLVIDKSLEPKNGDIVVAFIDGDFTLKQVQVDPSGECLWLIPANGNYPSIKITEENDFMIWGVLTYNIKSLSKRKKTRPLFCKCP